MSDPKSPVLAFQSRRVFLGLLAIGIPAAMSPRRILAALDTGERSVSFCHTHTGERLSIAYFRSGSYIPGACEKLNLLLRDFRNNKICTIDVRLFDMLYDLSLSLNPGGVFEIISGYRSSETNAVLRKRSSGVASQSLHMQGKAIDVRLTGTPLDRLKSAALSLARGGVGYYPKSGFVHLDTGRVRHW